MNFPAVRSAAALALLVLLPLAAPLARGAGEPEDAYAKYHRAALEGDSEEMVKLSPARRRNEVLAMSAAVREHTFKMAKYMVPLRYSVQRKTVEDTGRAMLIVAGGWAAEGKEPQLMYGTVRLSLEKDEWKIDESAWSSQKPEILKPRKPAPMATPAPTTAPAAAGKAGPNTASKATPATPARGAPMVGSMDSQSPGPRLGKAKPTCEYKPVMTPADLEACK